MDKNENRPAQRQGGFFFGAPSMGDNLGVKVSCGRWPDEPLAEGNCEGANLGGEEAGEQNLDWMNKNCVARPRVRDELA